MGSKAFWACVLFGVSTLVGCGGTYLANDITEVNRRIALASDYRLNKRDPEAPYVVDPPDVIKVEAVGIPDLNREVTVRQDGFVSLPLIQDVQVGGLTPSQIREKLQLLYARYYTDVNLYVDVTGYNSKFIFIYGEVKSQDSRYQGIAGLGGGSRYPYTGSQTVLDMVGAVGGFTNRAAPWRVIVTRGDMQNPERYRIDLKKLVYEGDGRQNLVLAQNDVIYVPPNFFAWLGYEIENAVFPLRTLLSPVFGGPLYSTGEGGGAAAIGK